MDSCLRYAKAVSDCRLIQTFDIVENGYLFLAFCQHSHSLRDHLPALQGFSRKLLFLMHLGLPSITQLAIDADACTGTVSLAVAKIPFRLILSNLHDNPLPVRGIRIKRKAAGHIITAGDIALAVALLAFVQVDNYGASGYFTDGIAG